MSISISITQPVIIVGAGPTGLALGAELRRLGITPLILDKLAAGANTSRAAAIHARTLEVLEPLGVTPELLQAGLPISLLRLRDRDNILASISFKDLNTTYPFMLACPQERTEAILLQQLQALGGAVQRSSEVFSVHAREQDVQVKFKNSQGLQMAHAKWVVACDGMHSIVREQAAIPFIGGAYEESFILADVEMDGPFSREEGNLFFAKQGLLAIIPLPDNHFRIIATVEQAPSTPSMADFQQILNERGPQKEISTIRSLTWASRFHIQHRLAKVLRQGRILLAGDAAHVHSPAGGQGMNTGIQDAITLAAALKETLDQGNDAALQLWEQERLKVARSVVKLTDRMTKMVTASSFSMKLLRNIIIILIGRFPFLRRALARKLSELDNR